MTTVTFRMDYWRGSGRTEPDMFSHSWDARVYENLEAAIKNLDPFITGQWVTVFRFQTQPTFADNNLCK